MSANDPSIPEERRFESLAEMQDRHTKLVEQVGSEVLEPNNLEQVKAFLRRGVLTGAILDAREDRIAAQGLLNFWVARLAAAVRTVERKQTEMAAAGAIRLASSQCDIAGLEPPSRGAASGDETATLDEESDSKLAAPSFEETLLAPFDSSTVAAAVADTDAWLATLPESDQWLPRRVMLRLVRLRATGTAFDPVPTARAALYDLDTSDKVDAVVSRLRASGVVRVSPGDFPQMDRIALRSSDLIAQWNTLSRWLGERAQFREQVMAWDKAGLPSDRLFAGPRLEEVKSYHDRNSIEREFVNASAYRQARQLEQAETDRRAKWLWRGLTVAAVLGWIGTAASLYVANGERKKANELARELERRQQLTDLRLLVRTLADVATAPTVEAQEVALQGWDSLAAQVASDEAYRPFQSLDLKRLRKNATDPENKHKVSTEDINQIRELRTQIVSGGNLEVAIKLAREQSFALVEVSTRGLVSTLQEKPFRFAEPFARAFWGQYWGEMLLVEGQEVEKAMIEFGAELAAIQKTIESPDDSLKTKLDDVSKKYVKGREKEFVGKATRLNVAQFSQLKQEFKEVPDDVYHTLLSDAGDRKVPRDLVERLRNKLGPLQKALQDEREKH